MTLNPPGVLVSYNRRPSPSLSPRSISPRVGDACSIRNCRAGLCESGSRPGGESMSDSRESVPHRRPHAPPMAEPLMEFDLPAEFDRLRAETTWSTGQNARTLVKYDDI